MIIIKRKLMCKVFVICIFLIKDTFSIVSPNVGIKTNPYHQDNTNLDSINKDNYQPVIMHHQYSQVVSNRPGSDYRSQYNNHNILTTSTMKTIHHHSNNYHQQQQQHEQQGSNKVYHQNENTYVNSNSDVNENDRTGRTSPSKLYYNSADIENHVAPYNTNCPEGATGQFPYLLDCRRFLNCWKGRGFIQSCAPGTVFNPDTLECDNPEKVNCLGFKGEVVGEIKKSERLQELPPPRTFIMTNPDNVKCSPGFNGIQPHPYDCTKFLNCAHGMTHIQNCGPGTLFNSLTSVCDFPNNVDCGNRNSDVITNVNHNYAARRPYNEQYVSPTRISTSYINYPSTSQHYYDHHHSEGCTHHSHAQYRGDRQNQNFGSVPLNNNPYQSSTWKQSNVVYSQAPKTTQIVYPSKWVWSTVKTQSQPNQHSSWSYTKDTTRDDAQISEYDPKRDRGVTLVFPNNNNDFQRPSKPNYPEQEDSQRPIKPSWAETTLDNTQQSTYWTGSSSYNPSSSSIYGNSNIPQSNYDQLHKQISELSENNTTSDNKSDSSSQVKVYYVQPVENSNEELFDNIAGGDIPVHPSINHSKNKTNLYISNDSEEEGGQKSISFEDLNYQQSYFSSSPKVPIPSDSLLPPHTDTQTKLINILVPSRDLLPPFTDEEWKMKTNNNFSWQKTDTLALNKSELLNNGNLYGGMLPPNPPYVPIPLEYLLPPNTSEEENLKKSLPSAPKLPSEFMLPPLVPEEENDTIFDTPYHENQKKYSPSDPKLPSEFMLPPLASEEEDDIHLDTPNNEKYYSVPIPSDHMLPPVSDEKDESQKILIHSASLKIPSDSILPPMTSEETYQKRISSSFPKTLNDYIMPPMTPEEEQKTIPNPSYQNILSIPVPSDHMLPPLKTSEEEKQTSADFNGKTVSLFKSFTPSDQMLPPLTPAEERQKVLNSTNTEESHSPHVPIPSDKMLPPMSPDEEIERAFNSSSSVIPLYDETSISSSQKIPIPPEHLLPPFSQQPTNKHYSNQHPSLETLDQIIEPNQAVNDSIVVQSQTIRVVTPQSLSPSLYRTTTRTPTYSAYNRHTYTESTVSKNSSLSSEYDSHDPLEALKTLLRPYFNRSGTITDEDMQKTETHIMKIIKTPQNNKNKQNDNDDGDLQHKKDVEFIFTGEQTNLNQQQDRKEANNGNNNDEDQSYHHPHHFNHHSHGHYHQQYHNHHHNHDHGHNHLGHSLEFHKNNAHLPNPFESSQNNKINYVSPSLPTPLPISETIPAPNYNFDVRVTPPFVKSTRSPDRRETLSTTPIYDADCKFDCLNGKCVKEFEVCDGINHCGNRLDEKYCDHLGYELRLSNDKGEKHMGRLEVKILDKWGYVCDDKFGIKDADVVCRELGYSMGASEVRGNSYYAPQMTSANNEISFAMDEVDCKGNETSLKDCDFKGWGVHDCTAEEVVGIVCKIPVMKCPHDYWLCSTSKECIPPAFVCDNVVDCADKSDEREEICNSTVEYRLVDGDGRLEGRLEVKYRGTWGTVCDDDFTETEAQVVCNSLGFHGKAQVVKNAFGSGSGPIWLDQVSCYGNETSLDKCLHWTWGENNCNHTEDVSIRCFEGTVLSPKSNTNSGIKGRSSKQPEPIDSEEVDMYLYQVERSSKMFKEKNYKKCGHFNANVTDEFDIPEERMQRVIQGTKAKRGHHPWQATIRTKGRGGKSTHWCGAVLISKKHLLTAAHCLMGYPKGAYFVRMGDHYANIAESSEIDVFIENWYVHEEFRKNSHMNNDIALVELKSPVRFNDYIQPICLPSKDASYSPGRMCTISGWGSIQSGLSTPSNQLRAAHVPIIEEAICKRPTVYGNTITEGMFCAGYLDEGVDACDGDSGGPLVCTSDDVETLYGIISWGQHCGYANKPGVYVKISKYIDWIHNKINFLMQSEKRNN